jgi:hypothetical protein
MESRPARFSRTTRECACLPCDGPPYQQRAGTCHRHARMRVPMTNSSHIIKSPRASRLACFRPLCSTKARQFVLETTPSESEQTADDHRSDLLLLVGRWVTALVGVGRRSAAYPARALHSTNSAKRRSLVPDRRPPVLWHTRTNGGGWSEPCRRCPRPPQGSFLQGPAVAARDQAAAAGPASCCLE